MIFDIGAYDGHKTAAFLRCSEKVVSVEPDPHNLAILKARFRNLPGRVQIEPSAVSNDIGQTELFVHHPGSAFNTIQPAWRMILEADPGRRWSETIRFSEQTITVPTTTLPELVRKYGKPDFVKIDAEGSEWTILQQLKEPLRFISFECLLPDYLCNIKNCIHYLDKLHPQTGFAIAVNEKLISGFLPAVEIIRYLDAGALVHFEIVVRTDAVS
ncbi:MAG: hypothetical protein DI538_29620 [Azospira oryzae]|nr:MAG: hypothetical protein DI538_29620 [Azospira oryzae]